MDDRFRLSREDAERMASEFGTPLYVLGEAHLRGRMRAYREAALAAYPKAEVTYASKANSTLAVLRIAHQEGLRLDVASEGELRAALAAGVPASACHLHGNNKSREEIAFALEAGVAHVVADNLPELDLLPSGTRVVLRLAPGVDPVTHAKISTGQDDTKFGFNVADGAAEAAVRRCLDLGLDLHGYHCHVGSQLVDPEAQRAGGEAIARFAVGMLRRHGVRAAYLNVGGGLGVVYTAERPMALAEYCRLVTDAVLKALDAALEPTIAQEPGRAVVAEGGVTLYRVGVVKQVPSPAAGRRTYACVDGGLSDNPRPALYGARYAVEAIRIAGETPAPHGTFTVSGKHCETDLLFPDVELPADLAPGDLLQVLTTGAYNASMASNYNRFRRPATVLVREDGAFALVGRRETWEELLQRETIPEGCKMGFADEPKARVDLRAVRQWLEQDPADEVEFPRFLHSERFVKPKSREWSLQDGLMVYREALDLARNRGLPLVLVLCCELKSGRKILARPPRSIQKAEERALTSPLIYRMRHDMESTFWQSQFRPDSTVPLDPTTFGIAFPDLRATAWYIESKVLQWEDTSFEIRRSVYFRVQTG